MEPSSRGCVFPIPVLVVSLNTVTVILAVSTMLPNPLHTLAQLHSRPSELPSWVDNTHLRYSLVVHPETSPLSDEEYVVSRSPSSSTYVREEQTHSSMPSKSSMVYIAICFRSSFPPHRRHLFLFQSHRYGYRQFRILRSTPLIHPPQGQNQIRPLCPRMKRTRFA